MGRKLTTNEFVNKAKEIHGDKYGYSFVNYTGAKNEVIINCNIHGQFQQVPNYHLR